jgi:hypothetical protein
MRLREQGIAANATQRRARGVTKKAQKQVIRHIDARRAGQGEETPSHATAGQAADVAKALAGQAHENPAAQAIRRNRHDILHTYSQIAQIFAAQANDPASRKIALDIVKFAQTMPPARTQHEEKLEAARRAAVGGKFQGGAGQGRARKQEQERDAAVDKHHEQER